MIDKLIYLDGSILIYIQEYIRNPLLTPIFRFITSLGNSGWIWILITVILLLSKKMRKAGIVTLTALLLSVIIDNIILKNAVGRIRPYEVIDGLQILISRPIDFSFPSGHTGSSFAAAVVLFQMLPKKYGIPALVLAAAIGFSRLYVGVHYPSDVFCGIMIGTMIAILAVKGYQRLEEQRGAYGNPKEAQENTH